MKTLLPFIALLASTASANAADDATWFAFEPKDNAFSADNPISLRGLNEKFAGENGVIVAKNGQFIHSANGKSVRFWAVNGPPHDLNGAALERCARLLAKYGVNLVRVHGAMFDKDGEPDLAKAIDEPAV